MLSALPPLYPSPQLLEINLFRLLSGVSISFLEGHLLAQLQQDHVLLKQYFAAQVSKAAGEQSVRPRSLHRPSLCASCAAQPCQHGFRHSLPISAQGVTHAVPQCDEPASC